MVSGYGIYAGCEGRKDKAVDGCGVLDDSSRPAGVTGVK